jgi:hypothetical protein
MSEQTAALPQPTIPAQGSEAPAPDPQPAEVDWKAKAREWESRAKANKTAADELAAIKASQMSEAEKAEKRFAEAEQRAVQAEARALRRDVALDFKLSKDDAALLDSVTDEDAMRALAGRLAKGAAEQKVAGNHVPSEGKTPSKVGSDDGRETARALFNRTP